MSKERNIDTLRLDGGCTCFDFINTVNSRSEEDEPYEYLGSYGEFMKWSGRVELLPRERIKKLSGYADANPKEAGRTLEEIKQVRELMYRIFSAIAAEAPVGDSELDTFNTRLAESISKLQFVSGGDELQLSWKTGEPDLNEPLWRVMKSAFDILTEEPAGRIKECEACGWIFLDQSKNKSRRWCNMQTCGSAHKAKKYYYRKKMEGP